MKENRRYLIEEYNPDWVTNFEKLKVRLERILGDNVIEIHHIGSTSIKGMLAKPQVDLLVVVRDGSKVSLLAPELVKDGFTYHGAGYIGHNTADEYVSENTAAGMRIAGIHILPEGNFEILDYLNFRDYLREHPEDRQRYIDIKKHLYSMYAADYEAYDSGKKELVLDILDKANAWASRVKSAGSRFYT